MNTLWALVLIFHPMGTADVSRDSEDRFFHAPLYETEQECERVAEKYHLSVVDTFQRGPMIRLRVRCFPVSQ